MAESINTDSLLLGVAAPQQRTLDVITDMIIPASADGRKPSARTVGVLKYIREHEPESLPAVARELERLDATSRERHGTAFADLAAESRQALVEAMRTDDPAFLRATAMHTVTCYYQDDRVLAAIGLEARPPFPKGYDVPAGDLSLLEPVRRRGSIVREA